VAGPIQTSIDVCTLATHDSGDNILVTMMVTLGEAKTSGLIAENDCDIIISVGMPMQSGIVAMSCLKESFRLAVSFPVQCSGSCGLRETQADSIAEDSS